MISFREQIFIQMFGNGLGWANEFEHGVYQPCAFTEVAETVVKHAQEIAAVVCKNWGHDFNTFGDVPTCRRCGILDPKDGIRT
jgi:hypothetical protein